MTTSDAEAMPLCKLCHDTLHHHGWREFEEVHREQLLMVVETINTAIAHGVLEINNKVAKELSNDY